MRTLSAHVQVDEFISRATRTLELNVDLGNIVTAIATEVSGILSDVACALYALKHGPSLVFRAFVRWHVLAEKEESALT